MNEPNHVSLAEDPDRSKWWVERRGLLLISWAIAWFYLWTATSSYQSLTLETHGIEYYNLLVDGILDGHLSLKYEGDPGIAKLQDPYDPAQNAPYRVLDMSYYKGKYYIYFGPTPALVLLLPWKVVMGTPLPTHLAAVIFCVGGYWISLLLMLRFRRMYFPEVGAGPVWLAALILGLANMAPALLRRPAVYELAIACAYFFVMLAFWSLHHAVVARPDRGRWLVAASSAYGLALMARPTCLYGTGVFALVLGWWWLRREPRDCLMPRDWLRWVIAVAVPLGVIVTWMLLYNYLRFENPFEFGQIYQLTSRDMGKVKAFSWSYLPFNAWLYLLMPAQHSAYFPFFLNALPPPMPKGYDGLDDLYGLLPNLPVVVLAGGVFLAGRRSVSRVSDEVRLIGVVLGCWFFAVFGVFLFFSGATIRYYTDFLPAWLLLSCLGMWSLARWSASRRWLQTVAWTGMALVAGVSLSFALMVSFQHAGLLREYNLAAFNRLARAGNTVSQVYNAMAGTRYGPLKVELKFPIDRRGKFEPLLVSGAFPAVDYIWALYTDDSHVQIGFEHTNFGGSVTQPIPIDYHATHTLEIEAGLLYPPEAHPYFSRDLDQTAQRTRVLRIVLDGVPYIDGRAVCFDPVSPRVVFGSNDATDTFGRRFTGEVRRIERTAPAPLMNTSPQWGPVQLALVFPKGKVGAREPLVVTGKTGKGDVLFVEYLEANRVRFALDHWGVGLVASDPVEVAPDYIQVIDVSMGSLYPDADPKMKNRLMIRLNGAMILDQSTGFHPAGLETQSFGINPIGGSVTAANFSGKIVSIKRRAQW